MKVEVFFARYGKAKERIRNRRQGQEMEMARRSFFGRIKNMRKLENGSSLDKLFIAAFLALLLTSVIRWSSAPDEVTGTVLVSDYSNSSGVPVVIIFGDDGEIYEISDSVQKQELLQHRDKTVNVLGSVANSKKGGKTIKVKSYEVVHG